MKRVTKKYVTLLAAAVMMLLCSVVSLAAEECPLTIFGQKPVPTKDEAWPDPIVSKNVYYSTIIVAGADRIEDSDLQIINGEIIEKELNTDNGKLPEIDILDPSKWSPYGGQAGSVDFLQIKNTVTGNFWYISVYRVPEELNFIDELRDYKKFVIYVNGYQRPELAPGWQTNEKGSWYHYGNGEHPANGWKEIDGKWYIFNSDGYIQTNTWTSDGYYVDSTGAWIPGYDEDLVEGATITYRRQTYLPIDVGGITQLMPVDGETITVPVSKVSDINRIYDNFTVDEVPELSREFAIFRNSKEYEKRMQELYDMVY